MSKLDQNQLQKALTSLAGWEIVDDELQKLYQFADFIEAMSFVNRVAELAEQHGHHPDIDIRYNKVLLALVTHDEGGITDKDVALARDVEKELG